MYDAAVRGARTGTTATNLGAEPTSFVGRASELRELGRLQESGARLITILGPGGAGKTRLARRYGALAAGGADGGADARAAAAGVWFCDLTEARTAADLVAAIAATLSLPPGGPGPREPAAEALAAALAARGPLLLILDNVEGVAAQAAEALLPLLGGAPETLLLVTSREPLGLQAEVRLPLMPLDTEDGDALFVERARARRPGWSPDDAERADVSAIVRRLDALPLAIELAAAWMGTLSPRALLGQLEDRFAMLHADTRDRPERHQSLRAALDSSWELLDAPLRAALVHLSLFEGGATLEAFAAVLPPGAEPGAAELARALHARALLRIDEPPDLPGEVRLFLFESVRAYAAEALAAAAGPDGAPGGVAAAGALRHAQVHVARGEALAAERGGPDEVLALRRLARDADNLVAAYRRMRARDAGLAARALLALQPHFVGHGPAARYLPLLDEACAWAERAGDAELEARLLIARAELVRVAARYDEAERDAAAAMTLADAHGLQALGAEARMARAPLYWHAGAHDQAEAVLLEALERYRALGAPRRACDALQRLGIVYRSMGRTDDSLARTQEAIAIARRVGNLRVEGTALTGLAQALRALGRLDEAAAAAARSLEVGRALEDRRFLSATLGTLALVRLLQDDAPGAARYAREGMEIAAAHGNPRGELENGWVLGVALAVDGRLEEAWAQLAATGRPRAGGEGAAARESRIFLAALQAERGETGAARATFAEVAPAVGGGGTSEDAEVNAASELLAPLLSLLEARRAGTDGAQAQEREARAAIEPALARASTPGKPDLVAAAAAFVRAAVARQRAPAGAATGAAERRAAPELVVGEGGRWFERGGRRFSLGRRGPPARILAALAAARLATPGRALDAFELLSHGWPGQKVLAESGAMRVYAAVATLRRLGLRKEILTRDDGYLLDPVRAVRIA